MYLAAIYSYTYDLVDNRREVWQDGAQQQNRSYNAANQVVGWTIAYLFPTADALRERSYNTANQVVG